MSTFSIKEAFSYGWGALKKNFWFLVGVFAIIVVVSGIFSAISQYATDHSVVWLSVAVQIASVVVQTIFTIGSTRIALRIYNQQETSIKELFLEDGKFWSYIVATILYLLIVLAGLILLIVPGIVWALKYQFYPWLIVEKNMKGKEAFKTSGVITKGNKGKLFLFWLATAGVCIVGFIIVGIGIIPAAALVFMANTFVYKKLSAQLETTQSSQTPPQTTL